MGSQHQRHRHSNQNPSRKASQQPLIKSISRPSEEMNKQWSPETYTALKAILSARLCSAVWCIISDCDETYNYWEPTHYLLYGTGMQTWEYSPQYSLRSYFYLLLHATPAWFYNTLIQSNRVFVFYFLRCVLALICSGCEVLFYRGVVAAYGGGVARVMLTLQVVSAGMFSASTAYLPSSFSMYCTFCAMGAWLLQQPRLAVFSIAVSALIGWPFAALVGVPLAADLAVRQKRLPLLIVWSGIAAIIILVPMTIVDSTYYGRVFLAPINLILYNVFTSHGPNLYGTEPWTYYFVNGFLNFNFAFPLALLSLPILLLCRHFKISKASFVTSSSVWLSLSPIYLWLVVFLLQSHKEERFLYPIYPLFCLGAAVSIELARVWLSKVQVRNAAYWSARTCVALLALVSCLSVSRIIALYKGYSAPISLLMELQQSEAPQAKATRLCIGKEWHRFPSSFFLPERWELEFIQSEFKGQLPQHFLQTENATAIVRHNFNDLNTEEADRYVPLASCHYLIDQITPDSGGLEPNYSEETSVWKTVLTHEFLDAKRSPRLLRAFYFPFVSDVYCSYNKYVLLENIVLRR